MSATHSYVLELSSFELDQLLDALDVAIGNATLGEERHALRAIKKALLAQAPSEDPSRVNRSLP